MIFCCSNFQKILGKFLEISRKFPTFWKTLEKWKILKYSWNSEFLQYVKQKGMKVGKFWKFQNFVLKISEFSEKKPTVILVAEFLENSSKILENSSF